MGKVADIKTKETDSSVDDFLNSVPDKQKQEDGRALLALMQKVTKEPPKMWGTSIIGFGNVRYKSPATGREVDWFRVGFSPRKANLTIYLGITMEPHKAALQQLGKHKTGVGCLYINRLEQVDLKVLEQIITAAAKAW